MFKLQRLGIASFGNVSRSLTILLCLSFYSGASSAMPITFVHGGTGSGTLGGEAFVGDFTILAQADTDAIAAFRTGFSLEHLFARIAIAGLGTFDLLTPTRTYVNHRLASVGFARSAGPDLLGGPSGAAAFTSWNMRTSLALIEGQGSQLQWGLAPIHTSGGTLYFNTDTTTPARFSAQVALPVTATWLLMLCAFPALFYAQNGRRSAH